MVSGSSALALRTRVNLIVAYKVVGALILVPLFPYGSFGSVPLGVVSKFDLLGSVRIRGEFNGFNFFLLDCGAA